MAGLMTDCSPVPSQWSEFDELLTTGHAHGRREATAESWVFLNGNKVSWRRAGKLVELEIGKSSPFSHPVTELLHLDRSNGPIRNLSRIETERHDATRPLVSCAGRSIGIDLVRLAAAFFRQQAVAKCFQLPWGQADVTKDNITLIGPRPSQGLFDQHQVVTVF